LLPFYHYIEIPETLFGAVPQSQPPRRKLASLFEYLKSLLARPTFWGLQMQQFTEIEPCVETREVLRDIREFPPATGQQASLPLIRHALVLRQTQLDHVQ
jgi:hypothetical protein